ncbi:MAG TPA: hypothetical protein VFN61_09130 [Acidimicrobiales bacterium]|nr:hypothetical protein [Acidimicrobiales bacterium]
MAADQGTHAAFAAALDDLLEALDEVAQRRKDVSRRAERLRRQVDSGRPLAEIVSAEDQPLIVETLREASAHFLEAFSRFQRAEAKALHEEGLSMEKIGRLFGLSRQRVAALLDR